MNANPVSIIEWVDPRHRFSRACADCLAGEVVEALSTDANGLKVTVEGLASDGHGTRITMRIDSAEPMLAMVTLWLEEEEPGSKVVAARGV